MMRKQNDMTMYVFLAVVLLIFVLAGMYFGNHITEAFTQYSYLADEPILSGAVRIRNKDKSPAVIKPKPEPIIRGPRPIPPAAKSKKEAMKPISISSVPARQERSRFFGIF